MKLNILHLICLINCVFTFPNDLFDELWDTNQLEPQSNNNSIESQPEIKVEPHEEQFNGRWRDESALKGIVKVEHEPHYGAVNVEGTDKIKHEFEWRDEESGEFKELLDNRVKEEDQDGQAPNTSDHKKIGDNSNKHLSDQNNSTDQDESVDEQQNESNKCEKIKSDQRKWKIIQKFREIKDGYRQKGNAKEWNQIETKIANSLGVCRTTIYKWIKELGLKKEKNFKSKFSDLEKREILKQFDEIKSKCKKDKLKNFSKNELDDKIGKKLGVSRRTIYEWKRVFGLSVSKKISNATKIEILKKYAKIKRMNPKMSDCRIADLLKISKSSLKTWKDQFRGRK